jgi:O-antigen chain-terminating methyltransferase
MPKGQIDLRQLLECPNQDFLPQAFRAIIGREPDAIGLMNYASRLQKGLPRTLILAEMRESAEGRAHATHAESPELYTLHARYLGVRNLPLQNARWKLLPSFAARIPNEPGFHWERWANDTVGRQQARAVEQALQAAPVPSVSAVAPSEELTKLQSRLNDVAVALLAAVSALQTSGAPEAALQTLRDASQSLRNPPPDVSAVPWEARQALYWFSQTIRS